MNLQWLRDGNCTRTGLRSAGLALAAVVISTLMCTGTCTEAWAQAAARIQLSSAHDTQGSTPQTVFTARVSDVSGAALSTGTVSFQTAKGSIGSAVIENGTATLKVDNLPPATSSVTAVYSGDAAHSSASAAVTAQADATSTLPDFSVTATPSTLTLNPGDYGTIVVTIAPLNGFSEMVTLSCSGVPAASTCAFSPTGVTPVNGAVATSTLQIQTQAASGTNNTAFQRPDMVSGARHIAFAIVLPGMLALVGLGALRRRSGLAGLRMLGVAALLTASSIGLSSCAARYSYLHKPPAANPGIAAGTYTITLAAYATNGTSVISHTLNLTLTVK